MFLEIKELERQSEGSQWLGLTSECHQRPWMEKLRGMGDQEQN